MGKLAHSLRRRNGEAMAEVDRLTGESPSSPGGRCGRSARWRATPAELVPAGLVMGGLGGELDETIISTQRLLWQTEQRLAGNRVIADRLVSLSDPDARPIRKGRPPASTEFGSTMLAAEDERGFVCDHQLQQATHRTRHSLFRLSGGWPRSPGGWPARWSVTAGSAPPPTTGRWPSLAFGGSGCNARAP
jgi:hypothetical protein